METLPNDTNKINSSRLHSTATLTHPKHINYTSNTNKKTTKLRITIIQIIYEIWQSRNYYKYQNKLLPQQTIINKINGQLNSILLLHYKKHKVQDTLETFNQQLCINVAIAKLQNKTLINFIE